MGIDENCGHPFENENGCEQSVDWYNRLEGTSDLLVAGTKILYTKIAGTVQVKFHGKLAREMRQSSSTGNKDTLTFKRDHSTIFYLPANGDEFRCFIRYDNSRNSLIGFYRIPKNGDSQSGGWG